MKKLILIVIMMLSGWVLGAQEWGGRYFMVETEDGSTPEYRAELYLIPMGKNKASFDLQRASSQKQQDYIPLSR